MTALPTSLRLHTRGARHASHCWHSLGPDLTLCSSPHHLPPSSCNNFAGKDPDNPLVRLSTPRAMADRYMELYHNAQHMHAMLQPECAYALQLLKVMTRCFSGLGDQVLDSLCRNGIKTSTGYHLYELVELTLDLIGTSASKIWELNRTLFITMSEQAPGTSSYPTTSYPTASYSNQVNQSTAPIQTTAYTASASICPRCVNGHDPNCWVHNPTHHLIPRNQPRLADDLPGSLQGCGQEPQFSPTIRPPSTKSGCPSHVQPRPYQQRR